MWSAINAVLTACFDLLLWPFSWAPVWLQLCVMAVPATAIMLLVFRFGSSQAGLDSTKDAIKANLLELWIYRDDLFVSLRAQWRLIVANLRYLALLIPPIAIASIPILLMLVQVESRFAWRGLLPGETVILSVELDSAERSSELSADLSVPPGLTRETPALRIDARQEIAWRLRADEPGEYQIDLRIGDTKFAKRAVVHGNGSAPSPVLTRTGVSPQIRRASDPQTLLYPLESPIAAASPVRAMTLDYPRARGEFLELSSAGWLFVAVSFVLAFVFRGAFGVTF